MRTIKTVLTDVDATIVDNRERRIKAVERVLGIRLEDEKRIKAYSALTVEDVAMIAGVDLSDKVLKEIINEFLDDLELYELDKPAEDSVKILNNLASDGVLIIYVTGRPGIKYVEPFLKKMGFPPGPIYYERIMGVGGAEIKKNLLKKALMENKLKPSEAVSLGDMPHDGLASRSLNIYSIGTTQVSSVSPEILRPYFDEVIMHISSLPALIKRLESKGKTIRPNFE